MQDEIINPEAEVVSEVPVVETTVTEAPATESAATESPVEASAQSDAPVKGRRTQFKRNNNNRPARAPREKPEFDSKAIAIRRVTRVVSGGRRFSLHVAMVIGDRNGRVGLGTGKALDTQVAIEKAMKNARKNLIRLNIDDKKSVKHEVNGKYNSAEVFISPNKGKGLIAGSSARVILSLAGLQNVSAKFHGGTKNKLNNARATMKALSSLSERA